MTPPPVPGVCRRRATVCVWCQEGGLLGVPLVCCLLPLCPGHSDMDGMAGRGADATATEGTQSGGEGLATHDAVSLGVSGSVENNSVYLHVHVSLKH